MSRPMVASAGQAGISSAKYRLRRSLLLPYGAICAATLLFVGALAPLVTTVERQSNRLINEDTPALEAGYQLQRGLERSVASLRGWVMLRESRYRTEWKQAWDEGIRPAMAELGTEAGEPDNAVIASLKELLNHIAIDQWWIAEAAEAPGNRPAHHLVDTRIAPIIDALFRSITSMIDHEGERVPRLAGVTYLGLMADYRGFLARSTRQFSELITQPSGRKEEAWLASLHVAEARLESLSAIAPELTAPQQEALDYLLQMTPVYRKFGRTAINLRRSPDWNLALSIMRNEAVPKVREAKRLLIGIIATRRSQMKTASQSLEKTIGWVLIGGTLLTIAMIVFAGFMAVRITNGIAKPIERLAAGVDALRSGGLTAGLQPTGSAEFRSLIQTFNSMWSSLRDSRAEVEQRNQQLEAANEALLDSNRELDDFAYIASHDLKEPLRGIHNFSNFLLEDYEEQLDEDGKDKLKTLTRLTQRMETLIDSLLHFSRVGRQDLAVEATDLDRILEEVLDTLHISLESEAIEIRRNGPLPTVTCDRVRVAEVFRNLITNAMKYNDKPQKWIEIGAQTVSPEKRPSPAADDADADADAGQSHHVFHVRDNGIGIREKHQESIFRIFKRLHGRDKFGGGTGAGLTIVKKIVDRHDGRLWIESEHGEGTTFYFTLGQGATVS